MLKGMKCAIMVLKTLNLVAKLWRNIIRHIDLVFDVIE